MSITWVNGTSVQADEISPTPISYTVASAGNCLVISVGRRTNMSTAHGLMYIDDSSLNVWLPAITSPAQVDGGTADYQLCTFVALNCAVGATQINIVETEHFGAYAVTIDEYSGVAGVNALGQVSFGSTPVSSGLTTIDSGSITAPAGQLVYSAGYGMADPLTLTPTSGFTQRQTISGNAAYDITATSWDRLSSGGTYDNTVSASGDPGTMAVNILGLSATTLSGPVVQVGAYCISAISVDTISATYPYPNTGGNTLVATGILYERTDASITDTQGNMWTMVFTQPNGEGGVPLVYFGYCIGCKGGVNTVTVNAPRGGDDDHLMLIVAELTPLGMYVASNNSGAPATESTSNTGTVAVGSVPALLLSAYSGGAIDGGTSAPGPVSQLGTVIYQFSDSGVFENGLHEVALAYQIESTPGSYNNLFDVSPASITVMGSVILGFVMQGAGGTRQRCVNITITPGEMVTGEFTRDLDADWGDQSTFYITQSSPFPLTVRGLVFRESENND